MATYSNMTRVTGLNTGWDTDKLVTDLMKAESYKLNKLKKDSMLLSWRQEQYRSVYSDLKTFQSTFLSMTKSGSLRAEASFSKQKISVKTSDSRDSTAVTVGSGGKAGTYSIKVDQLAASDLYTSASKIGGDIKSDKDFRFDVSNIQAGASYDIKLDGISRKITFKEGDAVEGGTLTFAGGRVGIKGENGEITTLSNQGFIDVFNQKLKTTFGTEGVGGQQKVEAKLTEAGGISIFTNGYHSELSIADGGYNFASSTAANRSALASGAATAARELEFFVKTGDKAANISVSVTEGMTQIELLESLNAALEEKGLGNNVFFQIEGGKIKAVNFSATEKVEISNKSSWDDSVGTSGGYVSNGDLQYLGFDSDKITLAASGSLNALGITSGTAAKLSTSQKLSEIFGDDLTSEKSFTINGVKFSFTGDTKMSDLINQVNNSAAGVTMRYNEFTQSFELEGKSTGYANKINMSGAFLTNNLGFGTTASREAVDSVATINGTTIVKDSNSFEFLGVDWKLNKATEGEELSVTIERDVDSVVDTIKNFVTGYNDLIKQLGEITSTSRPKYKGSYYDPLTDEEKADMTEKEIENWEKEAKKGLLNGDSIISKITRDMRSALNQFITLEDGSKMSLYSIGITTSRDWTKGGELEIDEDKLRKAIDVYGDDVMKLFTKTSTEGGKGLAESVNDIFNSALSTTGAIASRAGITGTYTETNNELYRQLKAKNDRIEQMVKQLETKENNYYSMFAKMESAMSKYNSQSQYMTSMFG